MALQPIQAKISNVQPSFQKKEGKKPYIQANGAVNTEKNTKPLPGKGHLVHDNPVRATKYVFKDVEYTLKSVKDGIKGTANDHELGQINDFGLRVTGLAIATYLATKTTDSKARAMEFVGLLMFLLSMDIYPKLAINLPAKIVHGFDIDKQYIDDQGRKKSVFQDSNYIPYDLYRGESPGEDLDEIGDRMGIPRDIVNRQDVIKEKMRKVATQNNTLWMLTAGLATPAMAALACYGMEGITGAGIEKIQNSAANRAIHKNLELTKNMQTGIDSISENALSKEVYNILSKYEGKEIPQEELNKIIAAISSTMDNATAKNIEKDVNSVIKYSTEQILNREDVTKTITQIKERLFKTQNGEAKYKNIIPNAEEVMSKISSNTSDGQHTIDSVLKSFSELLNSKTIEGRSAEVLDMLRSDVLEEFRKTLPVQEKTVLSKESIKKIIDISKIVGDYKEKFAMLDKTSAKKFAYAPETILARSYDNFTKTFFKELGISYKDMKKMRNSDEYTREVLDKKLEELCKNEEKYKKTMRKLGKSLSDMEVKLNGGKEEDSYIKDLITSYENLYNNTAKRLDSVGAKNTADILVKEDMNTLKNSINSVSELFDFLDGIASNKAQYLEMKDWGQYTPEEKELYRQYQANGLGSAKRLEINTMVERYQGTKNTFNRIMHALDIYKTATNPEVFSSDPEYAKELIAKSKEVLLGATPSDYTLKLGTNNNPQFYRDLMSKLFENEAGEEFWSAQAKGRVTESTKEALSKFDLMEKGNVLTRFQRYLTRFRNIIANNQTDFTKPEHILNQYIWQHYTKESQTDLARYNLVGKNVIDVAKEYADKAYCTGKWLRIIGGITASVFGVTLLAQLGFGKIKHPENMKKQV